MTSPEILQSITDNNLTLVVSKKREGLLFEMYKRIDEKFLSVSFKMNPLQFKFVNTSLEQMIKNLMEQ